MNTPTYYPAQVAERKASELQAGDSEWTYTVRHMPNGLACIEVADESGHVLDTAAFFGP